MSAQPALRISTAISDVFDIPQAGVVLAMRIDLSVRQQFPEDWKPSLLIHAGISYRDEVIDKFDVSLPRPSARIIGISIGHAAPHTTFAHGDAVELR